MNKTNELYVLDRDLNIRESLVVDRIPVIDDIVSPQKTEIEVTANKNIDIGDFVLVKENGSQKYLGIVQDVETGVTTKVYSYPVLNITDNEFVLDSINGNVGDWIINTLSENFVSMFTDDESQKDEYLRLPLEFKENTITDELQYELKNGNLYQVLLDVFLKTGIYVDFKLEVNDGQATKILCEIKKSDETINIKYDNPIIVEKPVIDFSQAQSLNKIIFMPSEENTLSGADLIYIYYLLEDNTVTRTQNSVGRIKGVIQRIQEYTDEDFSQEQPEGYDKLQLKAEEILLGNAYDHQIVLKVIKNDAYKFETHKKVKFVSEKGIYTTYVTGIEEVGEDVYIVRLGVLRTKLTDTIKGLNTKSSNIATKVSRTIAKARRVGTDIVIETEGGSTEKISLTPLAQSGTIVETGTAGGTLKDLVITIPSGVTVTSVVCANEGGQYSNNAIWDVKEWVQTIFNTVGVSLKRGADDGTPTYRIIVTYIVFY